MKMVSGTALALALALTGCGGADEGNLTAAAGAGGAPLETIAAPDGGDWTEIVTRTDAGGFLMGNPDAPVKLIEYASMTCPACAAFSQQGHERLKNDYVRTGQVSFEFRNFLLSGPDAAASVLARCQAPSAFFRLTEQLFEEQQSWIGNIDDAEFQQISALPQQQQVPAMIRAADLDQFFRRRGVPEAQIEQCIAGSQADLENIVAMNQDAVSRYGINGTPSFVINDRLADATNWATLEPALRAALP